MQISLIAIGTKMPNWVTQGYQYYAQRIVKPYSLILREIKLPTRHKRCDLVRLMQQEGEAQMNAIPAGNRVIGLDERGNPWSTIELSDALQAMQDDGRNLSLLIGGPDGLAPACHVRANHLWSLSSLTFPHGLVRIIVAEQLYRAISYQQGHPYHRI